MDDLVTRSGSKPSLAEIQRRRDADSHAKANARLEGQFSTPESEAIFDSFIQGDIGTETLVERLKARHGLR
jgi:hypothetical protein